MRGLAEADPIHLDRVRLPILQRLARMRPPEAVIQGRVRLKPEVRKRLRHLVERWNDLERSQRNPKEPSRQPSGRPVRGPRLRAPDAPRRGLKRLRGPHLYGDSP